LACLIAAALLSLASAAHAQPAGCRGPEARQFDFWVGKWDVYPTGKQTLVAHSLIERLYQGCAIRENWMPLKGGGGGSLSSWAPADKAWKQTWVDSSGARVDFKGGLHGQAMVLEGFWPGSAPGGKDGLVRMTYTPGPDKSVRQQGQVSTDQGKTWQPSFDFTYRPAKSPA
jgi:hypothetical protein